MSWRRRIIELVLAGGTLAGCGDKPTVITNNFEQVDMAMPYPPVCNANPDPCCLHPTLPECLADGGTRKF
jgi:hypothetical protein